MRSASLYMSYNVFVRDVVGVEIVEVDSSRDHATDSVQSVAPLRQRRQNIFFNLKNIFKLNGIKWYYTIEIALYIEEWLLRKNVHFFWDWKIFRKVIFEKVRSTSKLN